MITRQYIQRFYDRQASVEGVSTVAELSNNPTQESLSQIIRAAMDRQHISGNMLAQAAGVSEGTIRNLLRENDDPDAAGPQALVLKAVCQVLGLDEIRTFQAAGFLSPDQLIPHISTQAEYLAVRFDRLPGDKQELLLGMLESLEKLSGILSPGDEVRDVLEEVRALRLKHPLFKERRLVLTDRLGRFLGGALGKLTHQTVEDLTLGSVIERLGTLYRNAPLPPQTITEENVLAVVNHPNAAVALNALLPRKNIPSNIEKLFWLIHPENKELEYLDAETLSAIEDLWELLVRVSHAPPHENTK